MKKGKEQPEPNSFEDKYPHVAEWVLGGGYIEVGQDGGGYTKSFVRALDEGGMIYEGETKYKTIDEALQALDAGIKEWLDEHG